MNAQDRKALEKGIEGWQEFCNALPWDIAAGKKQQLLEMARQGEPRPNCKHPLSRRLNDYTTPNGGSYDLKFKKSIIKLAPHWFKGFNAAENKKQLIKMAKQGKDKPYFKEYLGRALNSYIFRDSEFKKLIKKLAPHWFANTVAENKKQLIKMAKQGQNKPKQNCILGTALKHYVDVNGKSYDSKFKKLIKKLAPHWFANTATENKKQLIIMAKQGEPKPIRGKHFLAKVMGHYISANGSSYDPDFDKQIRKLAPHWFKQ